MFSHTYFDCSSFGQIFHFHVCGSITEAAVNVLTFNQNQTGAAFSYPLPPTFCHVIRHNGVI